MYYSPHTHLAIARDRHADMLREARQRQLAARVREERPSVIDRLLHFLGHGEPRRRPVTSPC